MRLEIKKMPSGQLFLSGKLNGVDAVFMLDTGAGATIIEEKNKEKFKLSIRNSEQGPIGVETGGSGQQMKTSEKKYF